MSDNHKITGNKTMPSSAQGIQIQGVDVAVADNDMRGRTQFPGVRLWGHRINLSGEDGIECEECEMREEIPDILQMSSGFREVVYKLYILGKFKNTRCEPEYETDQSVLNDRTTNVGYDPNKVHWTTTTSTQKLKLDDGYVIADGGIIHKSTSDRYTAGDMLTDKQWMQLVQEAQPDTVSLGDVSDSISDMGDSMSKAGGAMSDMTMMVDKSTHEDLQKDAGISHRSSTNTSVQMDTDVDDKSAKERFAAALCEKAGIR